jgi:hypothetical protein
MVDSGSDAEHDVVQEFSHPKLLEGFKAVDTEKEVIVEEGGRDVRYGLWVALYPAEGDLQQVDIELTKEGDIYFLARASLTGDTFEDFKKKQHLKKSATLADFVNRTIPETFAKVVSNRTTFKAVFTTEKLTFRQQLEFKNVKIFELDFAVIARTEDYVRRQAQFRYNSLQTLIRDSENRLQELITHVSNKNPQFGAQLKKASKFLK